MKVFPYLYGRYSHYTNNLNTRFESTQLEKVNNVRYLGVIVDNNLTLELWDRNLSISIAYNKV